MAERSGKEILKQFLREKNLAENLPLEVADNEKWLSKKELEKIMEKSNEQGKSGLHKIEFLSRKEMKKSAAERYQNQIAKLETKNKYRTRNVWGDCLVYCFSGLGIVQP